MNVKNLEFLKDGLKYLGFGEKLNADLESRIKEQPSEFKLTMTGEFKKGDVKELVDYSLDFRKSDQTDMFFFNRYQATLKNQDPAMEKTQNFYITKNTGVTAKEAFNLLSGRAVNKDLLTKEGQPFNAWLQLDFSEKDKNDNYKVKQFHAGYGYNLEETLNKYPIKELAVEDDRTKLMKAMQKGNLQPVTFVRDGHEEKMFVTANPQYKMLDVYDANLKKFFQSADKAQSSEQPSQAKEKKESPSPDNDLDPDGNKEKKSRKGIGV